MWRAAGDFVEAVIVAQKDHFDAVSSQYADKIDRNSYDYYFEHTANAVVTAFEGSIDDLAGASGLDLGCGVGDISAAIHRRCRTVTGADISDGMISTARETHNQDGLDFQTFDGVALDCRDGQFDFAVAVHLLHHLVTDELITKTLAELRRVTKPGGVILLVDVNERNPMAPIIQHLMVKRGVDTGMERLVPPKKVIAILESLGIEVLMYQGYCLIPHLFPWLRALDPILTKTLPNRILGKDYLIAGRVLG